jgi:drug/metabolite transporter (DMT)-like permease
MRTRSSFTIYHLFSIISVSIFATLEFAGKLLGTAISPYTLTAWRFLIGGLIILPFALRQKRPNGSMLNRSGFLTMVGLGILNVCLSMLILQLSIKLGKATISAIFVSMNPLFVSMFAGMILKERSRAGQIIALITGSLGMLLLVLGEIDFGSGKYLDLPLGITFALFASLTFGLYTVLTKRSVLRYGNMLTNSVSFISGALVLFGVNAVLGKPILMEPLWQNIVLTLYLGIFITGIAYVLYFSAMRHLKASEASMYFFLKPLIATFLAWIWLGERLTLIQLGALALIVLSMNLDRLWIMTRLRVKSG